MNILGIDIGTTSVKIVLSDFSNKKILESMIKDTNSEVQIKSSFCHEQNVEKIFDTITKILASMNKEDLKNIKYIGISGQMHGVMFWNDEINSSSFYNHSNLITWMDQRCNKDKFIDNLPKMPSYLVEELPVSSGYGCATIFHMDKFERPFLDKWKYAGNIVDFVACQICKIIQPVMSSQMAHSWGYFDLLNNCWFIDILKQHNFPVQFLPTVHYPGTIFGKTKRFLHDIPSEAVVYVGMGDLQCSMYHALRNNLNAAINLSTSSQFVVRTNLESLKLLNDYQDGVISLPPGLVVNPFFKGDYLLVAASLNGGNVLANYVSVLQRWIIDVAGIDVSKDKIWSSLLSTYSNRVSQCGDGPMDDTLIIHPIIFGERHCPSAGATISNISPHNCSLGEVYKSICDGLVKNLTNLLPLEMISKLHVKQLTCSGGVIKRHKCVEDAIKKIYGVVISEIYFNSDYDACVGIVDYLAGIL